MAKDDACHNAETALIHALSLLRNGQKAAALEMTIVAVGRIGALVPEHTIQTVSHNIADRIIEARSAG